MKKIKIINYLIGYSLDLIILVIGILINFISIFLNTNDLEIIFYILFIILLLVLIYLTIKNYKYLKIQEKLITKLIFSLPNNAESSVITQDFSDKAKSNSRIRRMVLIIDNEKIIIKIPIGYTNSDVDKLILNKINENKELIRILFNDYIVASNASNSGNSIDLKLTKK